MAYPAGARPAGAHRPHGTAADRRFGLRARQQHGLLRERWPKAAITGLDTSATCSTARRDIRHRCVAGNIAAWSPAALRSRFLKSACNGLVVTNGCCRG
jgi:hypothetical protein